MDIEQYYKFRVLVASILAAGLNACPQTYDDPVSLALEQTDNLMELNGIELPLTRDVE